MPIGHLKHSAVLILFGVGAFFAFALALLFLVTVRQIIFFLFFSIVVAAALRPAVKGLSRYLPYSAALVVVYLSILGSIVSMMVIVVPIVVSEVSNFLISLPEIVKSVQPILGFFFDVASRSGLGVDLPSQMNSVLAKAPEMLPEIISLPGRVLGAFFGVFTVMALSFYWLLTRDQTLKYLVSFLPEERRGTVLECVDLAEQRLGAYVWGLLIASAVLGVLTFIGLSLLGVRFALLLALFTAVVEIIPIIGPFIAAVPILLTATSQSLMLGIATLVFFLVVQQLEGYVITPAVQQRVVRLSPFVILLVILLGGSLAGITGALLAIPTALVLATVLDVVQKHAWRDGRRQID